MRLIHLFSSLDTDANLDLDADMTANFVFSSYLKRTRVTRVRIVPFPDMVNFFSINRFFARSRYQLKIFFGKFFCDINVFQSKGFSYNISSELNGELKI